MFRSVDWAHEMINVKWHLLIWHERKLCALTNAPPVQSIIIIIIIQKSLYTVAYSVTYQYINYLQTDFQRAVC